MGVVSGRGDVQISHKFPIGSHSTAAVLSLERALYTFTLPLGFQCSSSSIVSF